MRHHTHLYSLSSIDLTDISAFSAKCYSTKANMSRAFSDVMSSVRADQLANSQPAISQQVRSAARH